MNESLTEKVVIATMFIGFVVVICLLPDLY
jgi:hypothetical protein